jgi:hypothetical protein
LEPTVAILAGVVTLLLTPLWVHFFMLVLRVKSLTVGLDDGGAMHSYLFAVFFLNEVAVSL